MIGPKRGILERPLLPFYSTSARTKMAENAPGPVGDIDTERTRELQEKIDKATATVEKNIELAAQRGEQLDHIQQQTETIATGAAQFQQRSHKLEKKLWYKNMKMTMICTVVFILAILVIVGILVMVFKR